MRKTLYFVRHAESAANAGAVTMDHASIPLSPTGERQASRLADLWQLKPPLILASSFRRAAETARPLAIRHEMDAVTHPLLHEFSSIDPQLIEGMDAAQRKPVTDAYWQRGNKSERMGAKAETFAEFNARVAAFSETLDTLPDKTAIVGHGIWFALLAWRLLDLPALGDDSMQGFRRFQVSLPMPNCAVYELRSWAPGNWHPVSSRLIDRDEFNASLSAS